MTFPHPRTLHPLMAATLGGVVATIVLCLLASAPQDAVPAPPASTHAPALTPRFTPEVEIFGQKVNLTRYDLYERYERELTTMCYTHSVILLTLKRANRYLPIIRPIIEAEGLPSDFIYLAAIESSFNPRAYSPAKAAGIWQFMSETGRRYGLEINDEVDERYHIEKATRAACRYLREAYEKYGDWISAAASYNAGQARITKELAAQGQSTALNILLSDETSRYIFRIMAIKEIMSRPARYGYVLYADQLYKPLRSHAVTVDSTIADITAFAATHGTDYFHLKEFNPWLRGRALTVRAGKSYTILIPARADLHYDGTPYAVYDPRWVVDAPAAAQ